MTRPRASWFSILFKSEDFIVGTLAGFIILLFCPTWIENDFAKDIYGIGASVLAIIFSVYIAALAIIMSAADDSFVELLHDEGAFEKLMATFRATLLLLFGALAYSLFAYVVSATYRVRGPGGQHKTIMAVFAWLFIWSVWATLSASLASITYSQLRVRYTQLLNKKQKGQEARR
jgi:hypothetical protein